MGDRLRPLWDFDDLDASERRFRAQLEEETTDAGRAEVMTQLARVEGLRGRYGQCDVLLDEAEGLGGADARVLLERGRRARSSKLPGAGLAQFEQAFELAQASGEDVLAVDAAHMIAIVSDMEAWTARGVEIAASSDDPGVRYWLGPLYNNVGWSRLEAGDAAGALAAFERALASRERDDPRPYPREIARYAVGKALRGSARAMCRVGGRGRRRRRLLPRGARGGLRRARSPRRLPRTGTPRTRAHDRGRRSRARRAPPAPRARLTHARAPAGNPASDNSGRRFSDERRRPRVFLRQRTTSVGDLSRNRVVTPLAVDLVTGRRVPPVEEACADSVERVRRSAGRGRVMLVDGVLPTR
jgi:hypothetical protein